MNIKRYLKAPLVALIAPLALLAVPAAAQAHHISLVATCDAASNVSWTVGFIGFSSSAKPTTKGTVKLDGTVAQQVPTAQIDWSKNPGALKGSKAAAGGQTHVVKAEFTWAGGGQTMQATTNACPAKPALEIVKDGPSTRYVGDAASFTYKVKNIGNVPLSNPVVTDDKCAPVTKPANGQSTLAPNGVWEYTCTTTITGAMGDQLVGVGKACASYSATTVCATDDHKTTIPKPAISLVKSGAATATAGETFTYSFAARNAGNVHAKLDGVVLTDDRCQSTLVRVDSSDTSFNPGDVWNYTCTVVAPTGPAQVDSSAEVCGVYNHVDVAPRKVCAEDTHTFTVAPAPATTPAPTPAAATTPAATPAAGAVLPETVASGVARLSGKSGCVKQAFRARVSGRSIAAVAFLLDGKLVKNMTAERAVYGITLRPGRSGSGRHKLIARVTFAASSGTRARKLALTFRRCSQDAVAPRFAG